MSTARHCRRSAAALSLLALLVGYTPAAHATDADPWFGRDKGLHFAASFVLAGGGYGGAALVTPRTELRVATGAGLALGAGIAKEVYDRYAGGDPSWRDLTWDVVGTATGVVVAWLIDRYLF